MNPSHTSSTRRDPVRGKRVTVAILALTLSWTLAGAGEPVGDGSRVSPAAPCRESCCAGRPCARGPARYARSSSAYRLPDVKLLDSDGRDVPVGTVFDHDGPLLLQFIFTTCPTICPSMTATFSSFAERLDERERGRVRLVSITIDPENDRPELLRGFARKLGAGPGWRFYTGRRDDVAAVQKAFDAFRPSKMAHEPLTLIRPRRGADWVRLNGLIGVEDLLAEYRSAVKP